MKLYNEKLADRIREMLAEMKQVEEKKMFGGLCFMVNGKMCICARDNEMMCRIGADAYETALEKGGCRPMIHNGRMMKGFVFISEEGMKSKKDFDYWIKLAVAFNKIAKASGKKSKQAGGPGL
jgi:TfoX/Sxy family transcriptional regulator of competence genes